MDPRQPDFITLVCLVGGVLSNVSFLIPKEYCRVRDERRGRDERRRTSSVGRSEPRPWMRGFRTLLTNCGIICTARVPVICRETKQVLVATWVGCSRCRKGLSKCTCSRKARRPTTDELENYLNGTVATDPDLIVSTEFAGGKLNDDESPDVAACRELFEEVGISATTDELVRFGYSKTGKEFWFVLYKDKGFVKKHTHSGGRDEDILNSEFVDFEVAYTRIRKGKRWYLVQAFIDLIQYHR
jgi:hypothetical protein